MNFPPIKEKIFNMPKPLMISLVSILGLGVITGMGYLGVIFYSSHVDENVAIDMERLSREGITASSCREIQDIKISRLPESNDKVRLLDAYNFITDGCRSIKGSFGILSFFNPENDFRSSLVIDYSVPVYSINDQAGTHKYQQKEKETKEKLAQLLHFEPEVEIKAEDIYIYDKKIIISTSLEPQKRYTLFAGQTLLNDRGEKISSWDFQTPENKTFQLQMKDKVTLYNTSNPPIVQLLSYDSKKARTSIKLCRIDLESYAKTEVLMKNYDINKLLATGVISGEATLSSKKLTPQEEFFYSGIDAIKNEGCREIELPLNDAGESEKVIKKDIPLADSLKALGETGLFMVSFVDKEDRYFNERTQAPLLFSTINAHTIMKVGQNGEAFFFVNDFAGQPLGDIEMSVNINEFSSREVIYTATGRNITEKSPFEKNIYSKKILLGKTDKNGILRANLKGKVDDYFLKTFENQYEFEEAGKYTSFFVTGKNTKFLSFVSSQWNGGIAPWNFGYKVNSWYDSANTNGDQLSVNQWNGEDIPFTSHVFTDRVLYLPGETVSIKGIIRNSLNLSAPKDGKFVIVITDSQGKELKRSTLKANEFGSVADVFSLDKNLPLGYHNIILYTLDEKEIGRTSFSVEVFKNPKFTTEIQLTTTGLDGELIKIDSKKKTNQWYGGNEFIGKFTINADLIGKYYSGGVLANIPFDYKVYRQEYYDSSYWNDCYYGCFWEPNKEFYTEGNAKFDSNGFARLTLPIEFKSSYSDYRYIVEVTPRDVTGEVVSSTNATIVRLPNEYKLWDPNNSISFQAEKRFYPAGENVDIVGKLNHGKWDDGQENKYLMIVKKKTFDVAEIIDVKGLKRPVTTPKEELIEIIPVSKKRFTIENDGTIKIKYKLPETAEYVFEFGTVDSLRLSFKNISIQDLVDDFNDGKTLTIEKNVTINADLATDYWTLSSRCVGESETCSYEAIIRNTGCDIVSNEACLEDGKTISLRQKINVSDLLASGKQFFSLLTYSEKDAKNPVVSDNKIQVLSEKVSYKIGEKARILVRLPFSKGKILWTIEKRGVEKAEYIDVPGNIFFKEVTVDESFVPNAYIGVVAIETDNSSVPEYKVGYTEVVVDKTDKKSNVVITTDKKTYSPRDTVKLNIQVKDIHGHGKKSELTVMVVDDSLISLMGNIDTNTLEKIWKKLPFQIQTSITNIAMLKNYYFSRPGIVGGSGSENNKGGDSGRSTRNIFKNTAYYNSHVVTDGEGKALVDFVLPDNLTQFRVIVLSNALDNTFGSGESLFSVKKPVTLEDKTPIILRNGDKVTLGANVFNQSGKEMQFLVKLNAKNLTVPIIEKRITLKEGENTFVSFDAQAKDNSDDISYIMSITGDSLKNSDSVEGTIKLSESPTLIQNTFKDDILSAATKDYTLVLPENTLVARSTYEISISNNPIQHLESIVSSLLQYPYGCIEQTVSTTLPNVMAKKFSQYFKNANIDVKKADEQTQAGLKRIQSMQTESGGFSYWEGISTPDLHITPYVLRSLLTMKELGTVIDSVVIDKAIGYLVNEIPNARDNTEKTEIFYGLAKSGKGQIAYDAYFSNPENVAGLTRHERIAYTYGLYFTDKNKYKKDINTQVELIKKAFNTKSNIATDYWYWNEDSDKADFASLLMDLGSPETSIIQIIKELSNRDYSGYYISTQSKNASFKAFIKYIEKYGKNKTSLVQIMVGDTLRDITLTANGGEYNYRAPLSEVLINGRVPLSVQTDDKSPVFVNVSLKSYPADIKKVKKFENGITLSRKIEEVVDTKKLAECSNYYYNEENDCSGAFKSTDGINFKKGSTYRITLRAVFSNKGIQRNFTFEDYLPATFRVMNSKFRTNSIATSQNSTADWYYNHTEVLPGLVMSHAESVWGDSAEYTYFVIPEFSGTFTYPPASAYLMYNPDIRAYGEFRTIEVK